MCCDIKLINVAGGSDDFVVSGIVSGDDIILTRDGGTLVTIVNGALGAVDFTALTAQEQTDLMEALDFTQLLPLEITNITQVIDFTQLTAAQVTAMTEAVDFAQLTVAQSAALCAVIVNCAVGVSLQINAGNGNLELVGGDASILASISLPESDTIIDADADSSVVIVEGATDSIDFTVDGTVVMSLSGSKLTLNGIFIDPASGLELEPQAVIPVLATDDDATLWISSVDGHLYRGAVDLEASSGGFTVDATYFDEATLLADTPAVNTLGMTVDTGQVFSWDGATWSAFMAGDGFNSVAGISIVSSQPIPLPFRNITFQSAAANPAFIANSPNPVVVGAVYKVTLVAIGDTTFDFSPFYLDVDGSPLDDINLPASLGTDQKVLSFVGDAIDGVGYMRLMSPVSAGGDSLDVDRTTTEAALLLTTPANNTLAVASDTVAMWHWDGTNWSRLLAGNGEDATVSFSFSTGQTVSVLNRKLVYQSVAIDPAFVVNAPDTIQVDSRYAISLIASAQTTFQFSSNYRDVDGTPLGDITLLASAGTDYVPLDFVGASDGVSAYLRLASPLSKGSGLPESGNIPASVLAKGLFIADGTEMAVDLFAATNSQSRVMVSAQLAGIGTIISVQAGETLNGALNGTYTMSGDGELVLFIDNGVGEWTVQEVGAATSGAFQTQVETLTYAAGAVEGVSFTHDGSQGTGGSDIFIEDITVSRHYIGNGLARIELDGFVSYCNIDAPAIVTLPTDYLTDATWGIIDRNTLNASNEIVITFPAVDQMTLDRDNNISGTSPYRFKVSGIGKWVGELPNANVMSGMVTPTELSRMQVSLTATTNDSALTHYGFDETLFSQGSDLSLNASGAIDGLQPGKTYEITARLQNPGVAGISRYRISDLTSVAYISGDTDILTMDSGATVSNIGTLSTFFSPSVVTSVGVAYIDGGVGEMGQRSTFTVEEVPSSTIVNPDGLTPVELHMTRMRNTTPQLLTLAVETQLEFDTFDYNVGSMGSLATNDVTIVNDGIYQLSTGWVNDTLQNNVQAQIKVDGVLMSRGGNALSGGGGISFPNLTITLPLTAGQVVTAAGYTDQNAQTTAAGLADQPYLEVIQQPTSSVVTVPGDIEVNDQASSGYFDIGDMRMQWGFEPAGATGVRTITLPGSFLDADYSVVTTNELVGAGLQLVTHIESRSVTSFDARCQSDNGSTIAQQGFGFSWQAMGLKP